MLHRWKFRALGALLLSASVSACGEKGMTYGDANSVIAVTDQARWSEISDDVYAAIEKTIQTVRNEKTFDVTYQEPFAQNWQHLRRFRQMLLIGTGSDPWMQEAVDQSRDRVDLGVPGVYQIRNSWSRDQTVTLAVLPADGSMASLPDMLEDISQTLDRQFRAYARNRMFMSGVNTALADTLALRAGFRVMVPQVYRQGTSDSIFVFRNDQPDPSELIRQVMVTWRSPAPGTLSVDELLAWRQEIADVHYNEPQEIILDGMIVEPAVFDGREGLHLQSQWRNPPDRGWPAGGPLIVRTLTCDEQDRTYLIDAWLYAPSHRKYEYMIQLETILDSFTCGV